MTYCRMRSVHAKAWDSSPFILRQIEGVGEKSKQLEDQLGARAHQLRLMVLGVKVLVDNGITTFTELSNSDPSRLEMLLGRYVNR